MSLIKITIGKYEFIGKLETEKAPNTVKYFLNLLPFNEKVIHVKWSGEAFWIPLKEEELGINFENHTSHPAPGEMIIYPGGYSETELLIPYGATDFSSRVGQLAGNHFLTIIEGNENLKAIGEKVLWEGAQIINFEIINY